MKVALLLCGFLRTYKNNFNNLKENILDRYNCDIFLHVSQNECNTDKYINNNDRSLLDHLDSIIKIYNPKSFICEKEYIINKNNKIENNTLNFYHKIYQVNQLRKNFEYLNDFKYDVVIIMRPDIYFKNNYDIIKNNYKFIQEDRIILSKSDLNRSVCNKDKSFDDKICIGNNKSIDNFCNLYTKIREFINDKIDIISENILYYYLNKNKYKYHIDENIKYKIILSISNSIAISGDSGTGKSTLSKIINNIFKETLNLECDRYHKWERGDPKWKEVTHLNPKANYLLKMRKDFFDLKIGEDIYQVDYDHSSGKFTQKNEIKSKKNIILCGLHTLFDDNIVDNMNLNIYLDPNINLKKYWKIKRDMTKRGYPLEKVLEKIKEREIDYKQYIDPQKKNADLIISFFELNNSNYLELLNKEVNIGLKILTKKECLINFCIFLNNKNIKYNYGIDEINNNNYFYIKFKKTVNEKFLIEFIKNENLNINKFDTGYSLIIQIIILLYIK